MGINLSKDGISLNSIAHPKASFWKRIKFLFKKKDLSKDSIETIEIEIKDRS